jgi:hypothetical protein
MRSLARSIVTAGGLCEAVTIKQYQQIKNNQIMKETNRPPIVVLSR